MTFNRVLAPVALAAAAILVVVLGMRVRALNRENEELFRRLTRPVAGMYVPAFTSAALEGGGPVRVASPVRGRQVLFVFTTTCPYCRTSIPVWKSIGATVEAAYGPGSAVGVSLDSAQKTLAYVRRHQLSYPVVRFPDVRSERLYRTRSVPVTMVVDSTGRVVFSRVGELKAGVAVDSVLAAAGIKGRAAQARTASAARARLAAQPQQ